MYDLKSIKKCLMRCIRVDRKVDPYGFYIFGKEIDMIT